MKIKTSELTGAALDWAVAKCEDEEVKLVKGQLETCWTDNGWKPSTHWAHGGPIIEREKLLPCYAPDGGEDPDQPWVCDDYAGQVPSGVYWGATFLIAAMRCYVASKLGDEVEVPDELA